MNNYFEIMKVLADNGFNTEMCQEFAWNIKGCLACIGILIMVIGVLLIVLLVIEFAKRCKNDLTFFLVATISTVFLTILMSYCVVSILDWAQAEMIEWVLKHEI